MDENRKHKSREVRSKAPALTATKITMCGPKYLHSWLKTEESAITVNTCFTTAEWESVERVRGSGSCLGSWTLGGTPQARGPPQGSHLDTWHLATAVFQNSKMLTVSKRKTASRKVSREAFPKQISYMQQNACS